MDQTHNGTQGVVKKSLKQLKWGEEGGERDRNPNGSEGMNERKWHHLWKIKIYFPEETTVITELRQMARTLNKVYTRAQSSPSSI